MADIDSFKEKLEAQYSFPTLYKFKFIVPSSKQQEVIELFSNHDCQTRPSKNGKYVSVTISIMAESSDKIIEIYQRASGIEGIISL